MWERAEERKEDLCVWNVLCDGHIVASVVDPIQSIELPFLFFAFPSLSYICQKDIIICQKKSKEAI
jgi:hypothetical protein